MQVLCVFLVYRYAPLALYLTAPSSPVVYNPTVTGAADPPPPLRLKPPIGFTRSTPPVSEFALTWSV